MNEAAPNPAEKKKKKEKKTFRCKVSFYLLIFGNRKKVIE